MDGPAISFLYTLILYVGFVFLTHVMGRIRWLNVFRLLARGIAHVLRPDGFISSLTDKIATPYKERVKNAIQSVVSLPLQRLTEVLVVIPLPFVGACLAHSHSWLTTLTNEWLFSSVHFLVRVRTSSKLMLAWPGYDIEAIKGSLRLSGIDLRVLQCQQDFLWEVVEGLTLSDGRCQVGALVVDQEQASQLVKGEQWRITALPQLADVNQLASFVQVTKMAQTLIHGDLVFNPESRGRWLFAPVRFGFNGVCWVTDYVLASECEREFGDPEKSPFEFLRRLIARGDVTFYDWWLTQMLLLARVGCAHLGFNVENTIRSLEFDAQGRVKTEDANAKRVWRECMRPLLLDMKGKGYTNFIELREALAKRGQGPYVALGPGDSFMRPNCTEFAWSFLGKGGGLMWVECAAFSAGTGSSFFADEGQCQFLRLLVSERVQASICADDNIHFYANSPFFSERAFHRPTVVDKLQAFCPDRSVAHTHSYMDCISRLVASQRLTLREQIKELRDRKWNIAYQRVLNS